MNLSEEQFEDLFSPARNGLISSKYRWPNKTVPYELSAEHTKEQRDYIELAAKTIESVSCVKFVRRTNEMDYLEFLVIELRLFLTFPFREKIDNLPIFRLKMVVAIQMSVSKPENELRIYKKVNSIKIVSAKVFYRTFT